MQRWVAADVECYAGYRGEETPRAFRSGETHVVVEEVLERWLSPSHRGFRVRGSDGCHYLLSQHTLSGAWRLGLG